MKKIFSVAVLLLVAMGLSSIASAQNQSPRAKSQVGLGVKVALRDALTIITHSKPEDLDKAIAQVRSLTASDEHPLVVINVDDYSPAKDADLQIGDVITTINGYPTTGMSIEQAKAALTKSKEVILKVSRTDKGATSVFEKKVVAGPLGGAWQR